MRIALAACILILGITVTVAGAAAMYGYAIVADETGISGWNPMLWIVLLAGAALTLLSVVQVAVAFSDASRSSAVLTMDANGS